jgi:hypothetical protein
MGRLAQQQLRGNAHDIRNGAESAMDSTIFSFFSSFFTICVCLYPVEWTENRLYNLQRVTHVPIDHLEVCVHLILILWLLPAAHSVNKRDA